MTSINTSAGLMFLLSLLGGSPVLAAPIPPALRPIHVLNRLAYGPRSGDLSRVQEMGVEGYIQEQLPIPSRYPYRPR